MSKTRRETATLLAEELLSDIELSRIPPPEILKRASRLARLLDDVEAVEWFTEELAGFTVKDGFLTKSSSRAAARSKRNIPNDDKEATGNRYQTTSIYELQATVEVGKIQLQAAADVNVSISSANPYQAITEPKGNARERTTLHRLIKDSQDILGKIISAVHSYVAEKEIELRFGAAVESAFTTVRNRVDARIAHLTPTAATKFAAAFENAASGNPEHWANAASACRRLLKAIADELRPPGDPVAGRAMTDGKYINRLINWISDRPNLGGTLNEVIVADLEDFGKRIDAFDNAGHKGAHAEVTQYEASRFISGTYLLIGDILNLWVEEVDTEHRTTKVQPTPALTQRPATLDEVASSASDESEPK